jgi:putative addiction module killer protein
MLPQLETVLARCESFYGPGYRVYFVQINTVVVVLLSAGDKATQKSDILKAKEIAMQLEV